MGKVLILAAATLAAVYLIGCESPDRTEHLLQALERGKAEGHLVVTSDGRIGGQIENGFWLGAGHSTITFDGEIDFNDPLNRPPPPISPAVP